MKTGILIFTGQTRVYKGVTLEKLSVESDSGNTKSTMWQWKGREMTGSLTALKKVIDRPRSPYRRIDLG